MRVFLFWVFLFAINEIIKAQNVTFRPGQIWNDTSGKAINVHAGYIVYEDGYYYWIGDSRTGNECNGVGCYRSKDLYNWTNRGLIIPLSGKISEDNWDLAKGRNLYRPKILYNELTKKWIIWAVWENMEVTITKSCRLVSDHMEGDYDLYDISCVNGILSRDYTLFKDDTDGRVYFIGAVNTNADILGVQLNDDYLDGTSNASIILDGVKYEAPAIFKMYDMYFGLFSGCTYWKPNRSRWAYSYNMLEGWSYERVFTDVTGSGIEFCVDDVKGTTYDSQSAFVFKVGGDDQKLVYVGDRWDENNLESSKQVWLPISMRSGYPTIHWYDEWDLSIFDNMYRFKRTKFIEDKRQYFLLDRNSNRFVSRSKSSFLLENDGNTNLCFTFYATDAPYVYKLKDNKTGQYVESVFGTLRLSEENDKTTQLWTFLLQEDGTYKIKNNVGEYYLAISGSSTFVGSTIYLGREKDARCFGVYFDSKIYPEDEEAALFTKDYRQNNLVLIKEQEKHITNLQVMKKGVDEVFTLYYDEKSSRINVISQEPIKAQLALYNIYGQLQVYQTVKLDNNGYAIELSGRLNPGIYMVRIKTSVYKEIRKLIVIR
ncbi:T9SS type A sorting domain-containing protein [Bacteroides salyersiae]|uniref:T9SS type A sorting domain-containing protein n=1 Tax=Bacteroides salyersiae TaxID=291644 RepID=UPI001C38D24E|nr:T9SS type A sorting domain-containing protein [Bacteroides salyersiae]MBV4204159.1 T9SS type A sorting domain-containing protein [Bacteroides salyersiae]MCB6649268.1 T9SS type A sorting domain-containing protein [Bacteroides salyersiae]